MRTIQSTLRILFGSPLLWIGATCAAGSFIAYSMLWTGHLNWFARLADRKCAGQFAVSFLAFVAITGICLAVSGLTLGMLQLAQTFAHTSLSAGMRSDQIKRIDGRPVDSTNPPHNTLKSKLLVLNSLLCLFGLAFVLNRPCYYSAAPPLQLRITDENHQPVSGLRVVRSWGFSLKIYGSHAGQTGDHGTVVFAPTTVQLSLLNRLEMRWMPGLVRSWYPGQDCLPVVVYLPENLTGRFNSESWRPAIAGDPTAYTNQYGVFARYERAYILANQKSNPTTRNSLKIPQPKNTLDVGFPPGIQKVELQVCKNSND